MQWLKTLNIPFVGRLYPVSHGRLGVVHHHRVDSEHDHLGIVPVPSPEEQLLEQAPEQPDAMPGEPGKEALDVV